jgi:hydrogenase expression/formation protein HypC
MCLGIPGRIIEITDPDRKLARVDISGIKREINLACIVDDEHPLEACVGAWVIVHVGFALSRLDEAEAATTLRLLDELGELETSE